MRRAPERTRIISGLALATVAVSLTVRARTRIDGYSRRRCGDAFFGRGFESHRLHHFLKNVALGLRARRSDIRRSTREIPFLLPVQGDWGKNKG